MTGRRVGPITAAAAGLLVLLAACGDDDGGFGDEVAAGGDTTASGPNEADREVCSTVSAESPVLFAAYADAPESQQPPPPVAAWPAINPSFIEISRAMHEYGEMSTPAGRQAVEDLSDGINYYMGRVATNNVPVTQSDSLWPALIAVGDVCGELGLDRRSIPEALPGS